MIPTCLSFQPLVLGVVALGVAACATLLAFALVQRGRARRAREALEGASARLADADAAYNATRVQLEAILQSMEGGVLVLDRAQRVLNLNHAAESMLGINERQVKGRLLQEVVRQAELNRYVTEALAGPREEAEFALVGEPMRRIRVTSRLLDDSAGRPVGLILVLTDLTHLRRLESVRTDFASNVSHELRTPITNIKGYVETLLEPGGSADPEQTERFLRVISKNADRLGSIVEDMLMLAQLERPDVRESLAVDHTCVSPIIDSVVSVLGPEAEAKRITLEQEAPDDLCAMINQPLVEQALTNLVANAIRYSPPGTMVSIHASRANGVLIGDHVAIEVSDQGPGIAEEHLNRIFERFYRVDKARSRERGGTGLGLAIVKHIMNLHGGRVEVESRLGNGSVFRLVLPAS